MDSQSSHKHHYIPCFNTKRWAVQNEKLCQYSRPYNRVVAERKAPAAVGFEIDLYTLPGLRAGHQTEIEDKVFRIIDQRAAEAQQFLLEKPDGQLTERVRSDFTRLLMAFLRRTPTRISEQKANFVAQARPRLRARQAEIQQENKEFPGGLTAEQFEERWRKNIVDVEWGKLLVGLLDSEFLGPKIFGMIWTVRHLRLRAVRSADLRSTVSFSSWVRASHRNLCLPLTPRALFVATNNVQTRNQILGLEDNQLVRLVNERVAQYAVEYVYGTDASQLSFLEKRLGIGGASVAHDWTDEIRGSSRRRLPG